MPLTPPCHASTSKTAAISDANRLGLDLHAEAQCLPYGGPIIDIHTHINSPESAAVYLAAARCYGVVKTWTMTGLDNVKPIIDSLSEEDRDTISFIAVPDYTKSKEPGTFTTQWHKDIVSFYELGSRIMKLWSAPRARDMKDAQGQSPLLLDSPNIKQAIDIGYKTGYRTIMTHVGDPDTWFQTAYADAKTYGTKIDQFAPLERLLDQYPDVTWIGAHMGGHPEDLDWLERFMDRHPNYVVDTSATKWMVRELSRDPSRLAKFVADHPGRVLFGSDIVAYATNVEQDPENPDAGHGFDLYASRYWALRTLFETEYQGPSPIVDPDLHKVDPSVDEKATATLRGAALPGTVLKGLYYDAAKSLMMDD